MEHKISEPNARIDVADVLFLSGHRSLRMDEIHRQSYLERTLFCLQQQSIRRICPTVRL